MNDKIYVFRNVFYSKMPSYQRAFYARKQRELEEKLAQEKLKCEEEMCALNIKMKKSKWKNYNKEVSGPK